MLTTLAFALVLTAQDSRPSPLPSGSIPIGSDHFLADRSINQAKSIVPDPSLPGGRRATLRYVYWTVYVRPTGNVQIRAQQTCTHDCDNPGEHAHYMCGIGGCASECPYGDHNVTLEATASTSREETISRAIERARETIVSVSASAGVSAGPVTAGLSASAQSGQSESESISSSITTAVGQAVSGSVTINLTHFNTKPCTRETWYFGTVEYEVRLRTQVFAQDYSSPSWGIGGTHGVVPNGGLQLAGGARFVGDPQDVRLATYQVPTNEPLSKNSTLDCPCKPVPVITPGPGERVTSAPTGTSKFYVTPGEDEKVEFTNPTDEPLILTYAGFEVTLEPDEKKVVEPNDFDGDGAYDPTWVLFTRTDGTPYAGGFVNPPSEGTDPGLPATDDWNFEHIVELMKAIKELWGPGGQTPKSLHLIDDFNIPSATIPEAFFAEAPQTFAGPSMSFGGVPGGTVPMLGNSTPILKVSGDLPPDVQAKISPSNNVRTTEDLKTLCRVLDKTGERATSVFMKFDGIDGTVDEGIEIIVTTGDGQVVSSKRFDVTVPQVRVSLDPVTGPAGSTATMTIDACEMVAFLSLTSGAVATDYDAVINYGAAGGATGPARVPLPNSGIVKVPVRRGSAPGGFQVAVSLEPRD